MMATAQYPFHDHNEYLIFQRIKNLSVDYPEVSFFTINIYIKPIMN